jgi:uracil DNA glycosylase
MSSHLVEGDECLEPENWEENFTEKCKDEPQVDDGKDLTSSVSRSDPNTGRDEQDEGSDEREDGDEGWDEVDAGPKPIWVNYWESVSKGEDGHEGGDVRKDWKTLFEGWGIYENLKEALEKSDEYLISPRDELNPLNPRDPADIFGEWPHPEDLMSIVIGMDPASRVYPSTGAFTIKPGSRQNSSIENIKKSLNDAFDEGKETGLRVDDNSSHSKREHGMLFLNLVCAAYECFGRNFEEKLELPLFQAWFKFTSAFVKMCSKK